VLLFELFPAFVAVVAVIVGTILFIADRRAAQDPDYRENPRVRPRDVSPEEAAAERQGNLRRPSMKG
jgi:hypothetical protein